MTSHAKEHKDDLIEAIVAHSRERLPRDEGATVERLVRQIYAGVAPEDLVGHSAENLYGAALGLWRFASKRRPRTAKIRVYNPNFEEHGWQSTHTIVEIVNDDMPFLVDSVTADLNRHDLTVHLLIHPILGVRRDSAGRLIDVLDSEETAEDRLGESILHIEVSQQAGQERLDAIRDSLARVLTSVRAAVEDWRAMMAKLDEIIGELESAPPKLPDDHIPENVAFLQWMRADNFTFLGFREYRLEHKGSKDYLRLIEDSGLGLLREISPQSRARSEQPLSAHASRFGRRRELLIITKTNTRSTVHRPVYMDYIGIRRFDAKGRVVGERRFIGLFTSAAYNRNAAEIPLLRRKVAQAMARSHFPPGSHNAKALLNILETYPRDELFQIGIDDLLEFAHGILHLEERQRIRLFVRRDDYARFFSCLVYVPRERYNTGLREHMASILVEALGGASVEFTAQVSEAVMARLHFIVHVPSGVLPEVDVEDIEQRLVGASRLWRDDLRDACIERWGEARGMALFHRYHHAFPAAYHEDFGAQMAASDIAKIEDLAAGAPLGMNLYNRIDAPEGLLHFKVYHPGVPVPLSDILPMLEHMGLKVIEENPYRIAPEGTDHAAYWIHDFSMTSRDHAEIEVTRARARFQDAFARIWAGEVENDGFNALVLGAGLEWREVIILRAYCKYLRQTGVTFSQHYMEATLGRNGHLAHLLVDLFRARLDPAESAREKKIKAIEGRIAEGLDAVANLDEDRIIRRFRNLVRATLRTNYYQTGADGKAKPALAVKLDSHQVDELPAPRPWVEVFVYSPHTEAIHLRGGKVARGGIRWSDRLEDFRTEVLGLMKAQTVKNAVIVPVGAKGGFVVKRPPAEREALAAEVVACYRTLISGLLDITDNLVGGKVVPPAQVVRHDADDPYLVVAADKGTATFSDIANAISAEYGFWLGDAFASGGSTGYDHKKMAITARGAWESVKRHFREIGLDTQATDFTVVGIGDMSGDVFGNGMLMSPHIRLIGAFNHLHVFFDPDPDAARSFRERQRLFALPRSSWSDYDAKLIAKGGGVFDRKAKAIAVTPQMKKTLGLRADRVTPNELIRALLKAPVDLLWNGGIGTYVKAHDESNAEVGDRANDGVRIDATALRCKVVGEGGNLGFTQRGRVACALAGIRLNTDAIDNSAGVDCSDHEVNIKILLDSVVGAGDMTIKQRNALLAEMTDEVARLVLLDNYRQTQAISVDTAQAPALLGAQAHLIRTLEWAGKLDRAIEGLPDDETLGERQKAGIGLTRPEDAVLLAYAKMALYDELLDSALPEDPQLERDLMRYFPTTLQKRCKTAIRGHRLRREIIATSVTNSMVNRVGPTFVNQILEETAFAASEIARAYTVTRDAFDLRAVWSSIEALDNRVPTAVQIDMLIEAGRLVSRCTLWLLRNQPRPLDISAAISRFTPGIQALAARLDESLSHHHRTALEHRAKRFTGRGVPEEAARRLASLDPLASALDIVQAAERCDLEVAEVGRVYFQVGERLGLDWLRASADRVTAESYWQRQALSALVDDLYGQQRAITAAVLDTARGAVDGAVERWIGAHDAMVARNQQLIDDLRKADGIDLAMLTVADRQVRTLATE